jgi:hypothetical protein
MVKKPAKKVGKKEASTVPEENEEEPAASEAVQEADENGGEGNNKEDSADSDGRQSPKLPVPEFQAEQTTSVAMVPPAQPILESTVISTNPSIFAGGEDQKEKIVPVTNNIEKVTSVEPTAADLEHYKLLYNGMVDKNTVLQDELEEQHKRMVDLTEAQHKGNIWGM